MRDRLQATIAALAVSLEQKELSGTALGNWRWQARQRLVTIRDDLGSEPAYFSEGWLAARAGAVLRERNVLMSRLMELGPVVLGEGDMDRVRADLRRLLTDLKHHLQRLSDLAYDDVEMEIGGSE
ncbi:MAG: hypothetical protein L0H93_11510 [Nocardioides sp.]|nr:hypothetical protein [Nocardioides sp.]